MKTCKQSMLSQKDERKYQKVKKEKVHFTQTPKKKNCMQRIKGAAPSGVRRAVVGGEMDK